MGTESTGKVNNKSTGKVNYKSMDEVNYKSMDEVNDKSRGKVNYKSRDEVNDKISGKVNDKIRCWVNDKSRGKVNDKGRSKVRGKVNDKSRGKVRDGTASARYHQPNEHFHEINAFREQSLHVPPPPQPPPPQLPYSAFQVSVQQGTPLYATVLAENHAETWSRFISQPVVMDTTPPIIDQLNVTITYSANTSSLNVTAATAIAKWTVEDAESGSVSCSCELGKWHAGSFFLRYHSCASCCCCLPLLLFCSSFSALIPPVITVLVD